MLCSPFYSAASARIHQVEKEKSFWTLIHVAATQKAHLLLLILFVCQSLCSLYTSPSVLHPDSHSTNNCLPGFKGSHTGISVSMVTKDPCNPTKDFTVVLLLLCKHTKLLLAYRPLLPAADRIAHRTVSFWGLWVIRPCKHQFCFFFFFLTGPLVFQILVELVR